MSPNGNSGGGVLSGSFPQPWQGLCRWRDLIISISSPALQQVRFHSYLAEHSISHPAYPLYNVQYLLRAANAALPCLVNIITVAVT